MAKIPTGEFKVTRKGLVSKNGRVIRPTGTPDTPFKAARKAAAERARKEAAARKAAEKKAKDKK